MEIQDIINVFKTNNIEEIQVSKRIGLLSSTWLIIKKSEFYYYFDINQKLEFINQYKYTEKELIEEFRNSSYKIDFIIN